MNQKSKIKKFQFLFEVFTGEKFLKHVVACSEKQAKSKVHTTLSHYPDLKVVATGHQYV
jgi:hypothetical protein